MTDPAFVSSRPTFKVDGRDRTDLATNLQSMVVNLPLSGFAHAELQLLNWGRASDSDENPDFLFSDIALGAEVEILIGQSNPVSLFKGDITALEENYGAGQPPQLTLLLQDKLHKLARERHQRSFEAQTPNDLAQTIARAAGLQADADIAGLSADWLQLNESDLAFLLRIAGQFDIAVRQDGSRLRAKPEEADSSPIELSPQDGVISARIIADLNQQAKQTQVSGYNLADAATVDYTAGGLSPAPPGTTASATLGQLSWPGDEVMPQPFARSNAEAEAYAKAHLRRQGKRFLRADLQCVGNPALRAGREVRLDEVSERMKGLYQVVHCTHRFDTLNGYTTHVRLNRGGWQP